jgi:cytosine/creatinine deaminase
MGTRQEIQETLGMVTEYPARILRLANYGVRVGGRADLILWDTQHPDEIITALAPLHLVVKGGHVTVEHEHVVREPWRDAPNG